MKVDCNKDVFFDVYKLLFIFAIKIFGITIGIYGAAISMFGIELNIFVLLIIGLFIFTIIFYNVINERLFNLYKIKTIELNSVGMNIVDFKNNNMHYALDEIEFQTIVFEHERCIKFYYNDEPIGIVKTDFDNIRKFLFENRVKYAEDEKIFDDITE